MKIAAIDLGTNACLLLIAEIDQDGIIEVLHQEQRLPRLGKSVDRLRHIPSSSFPPIASILREYAQIASEFNVTHIAACATSAVRDAANSGDFIQAMERASGIRLEVISGEDEALLTFKGARSGLAPDILNPLVIDIGGGSTELSYPVPGTHNGNTKLIHASLEIGAVRLTERFFKHSPPAPTEVASARNLIVEELSGVRNPGFERFTAVGVAGTLTTLAALDQGLSSPDAEKIRGYVLPLARVGGWLQRLVELSGAEIRRLSESTAGREDILAAGVLILHEILTHFRIPEVLVSERGLRFGVVLREWERLRKTGAEGR